MRTVEVFADVCCPFTHAGLRRLVERRKGLGATFALRVRAWPLELVNGRPLDPQLVAEEVDELRAQVAPEAFAGFDADRFPATSLPAFGLAAAAYGVDLATGERASLAVRHALFEEGRDIADPAELAAIAATLGVALPDDPRPGVEADWAEGRERGVIGSPHFFVDGGDWFCPALDIQRVDGHLRIAPDQVAFDDFVARCAAP